MAQSSKPSVNKLLRVLVAGGVALAGLAATARADDKPATETGKPKKAAGKPKEKAADKAKQKDQAAPKAEGDASSGGGVKGW